MNLSNNNPSKITSQTNFKQKLKELKKRNPKIALLTLYMNKLSGTFVGCWIQFIFNIFRNVVNFWCGYDKFPSVPICLLG